MRPQRNVVSKYQRNQKENDVQSVSLKTKSADSNKQTRPLRRALADKTNSGSDENKKPAIMEYSERPKRQARLPARLSDKSIEISSRFHNLGKPSSTSTPLKLKPKVTEIEKKLATKKLDGHTKSKAADSNNNPNSDQTRLRKGQAAVSPVRKNEDHDTIIPIETTPPIAVKKILPVFETKRVFKELINTESKDIDKADDIDVYEFDFDPSEEPVIKKKKPVKKRRGIVKEKLASAFFVKENYTKKIDKKLEELKKIIALKAACKAPVSKSKIPTVQPVNKAELLSKAPVIELHDDFNNQDHFATENVQSPPHSPKFMDDLQFQDNDDVPGPAVISKNDQIQEAKQGETKSTYSGFNANPIVTYSNTSIRSDLSFLEEMPVACSSFNVSQVKKHPSGSPWRANFEVEPKRWPVNFYLKPGSMTPAYEGTFHSVDLISDRRKVYAPIPTDTTDPAIQTPEKDYSQLKQSSILTFFEEVMNKSASKKVRKSKLTPKKFDLFYDTSKITNKDLVSKRKGVVKSIFTTPTKLSTSSASTSPQQPLRTPSKLDDPSPILESPQERSPLSEITSLSNSGNVISATSSPNKNYKQGNIETSAEKKKKEITDKCFGFDDSDEENDQENVSPQAINVNRQRGGAFDIGMRKRRALKEVNIQRGPMRVDVPLKPKLLHAEKIPEKILDLMSQLEAASAQKKPSKPIVINESSSDSSEGVVLIDPVQPSSSHAEELPLFTDIDFVHYNKPERRSYGKSKQLPTAKRLRSTSIDHEHAGSDLDLSAELTVNETKRKPVKKRKVNTQSKKEEKEADEWAAGFNSMLEEVDEFTLVVE